MDAISDGAVESVVIMSSSQVGKSEALNNAVAYHIDQDPAPIMLVMPTERDAEAWSKDRFSPMARDTPCLAGRISDPKSRDGSNKILHKRFPGGHLTIVGANAPSGLASRPIRILLCDEVDRYPFSAGAEGDPVNLAKKRTVTFWNRKIVLVSTPTIRGASRIETAYAESDRRQYWVPCPACGAHQVLVWGQVRWESAGEEHRPETARYHCIACDAPWSDALRWSAIRRGEWRARAPFKGIAGFHLNEICSSWVRLEAMARAFLSARAGGDEAMKTFVNTSLGETWMESGEAPDWRRLADRREAWGAGTVPGRGLFLTAGADVQKDRIEVDVWAWGRGLESWLVDHLVLEGGPGDPACWRRLTDLLGRTWEHASGQPMTLARLAIDTGYETSAVYAWSRQAGFAQVAPVKGVEGFNRDEPGDGPDLCGRHRRGQAAPARGAALDGRHLDLQDRDLPLPAAGPADAGGTGRRRALSARHDPPAGLGGRRVAQAVHGRAARHGEDEARLRPARMAEAARAQRGARHPGLCPRGRVDPRGGPLVGGALGRPGDAAGDRRRRSTTQTPPRPQGRSAWLPIRCGGGRSRRTTCADPDIVPARNDVAEHGALPMATIAELRARREALSAAHAPPASRGSATTARPWTIAAWPRSTGPSRRSTARSRRPRDDGSCGRSA